MRDLYMLAPLLLLMAGGLCQESSVRGNPLEPFSFVVGNWSGTFKGYPTARMPQAFQSPAKMTSRWGPQHAWIDSEATTEIPQVGQYCAKVIARFDRQTQMFDSFVVNTFGNGVRYAGKMTGNKVTFEGKAGETIQRVTYENVSPRELRFFVEESHDEGISFQPHSEILWKRD